MSSSSSSSTGVAIQYELPGELKCAITEMHQWRLVRLLARLGERAGDCETLKQLAARVANQKFVTRQMRDATVVTVREYMLREELEWRWEVVADKEELKPHITAIASRTVLHDGIWNAQGIQWYDLESLNADQLRAALEVLKRAPMKADAEPSTGWLPSLAHSMLQQLDEYHQHQVLCGFGLDGPYESTERLKEHVAKLATHKFSTEREARLFDDQVVLHWMWQKLGKLYSGASVEQRLKLEAAYTEFYGCPWRGFDYRLMWTDIAQVEKTLQCLEKILRESAPANPSKAQRVATFLLHLSNATKRRSQFLCAFICQNAEATHITVAQKLSMHTAIKDEELALWESMLGGVALGGDYGEEHIFDLIRRHGALSPKLEEILISALGIIVKTPPASSSKWWAHFGAGWALAPKERRDVVRAMAQSLPVMDVAPRKKKSVPK